ncbi:PIN domain-containing protein [Flavobacterium phragmitis]|uniref:PIN domain-containing protein n=1 Tax=Flavobacterium phragmitis TaxID=739143 RepID=A0A1I1LZY3_9FLAO|nr:hypothetical protein [Flavobacterium phragmitis]SFC75000.1 hypothetical protein SAMN05216297_102137 [Flavobacterium phragmitis]
MTNIILDSNIILRQPKILGLQIPGMNFLVPMDVIEELNTRAVQRGAPFDKRIELITKASVQGTISIINPDSPFYRQYRELVNNTRLSGPDISIIAIALGLINKGDKVKIATQDKVIWKVAEENDIEILHEDDINNLLANFVQPTKNSADTVQKEISNYEKKEKKTFFSGIFTGTITTLTAVVIYKNIDILLQTINVWGTIIVIIIAAVGLFVFRERRKLSYGVFEFLVGIVTIIMLFQPVHFNLSTLNFNMDFNIRLIGGLYIMVRGQDNIVKGIKDTKIGLFLKDRYGIGS